MGLFGRARAGVEWSVHLENLFLITCKRVIRRRVVSSLEPLDSSFRGRHSPGSRPRPLRPSLVVAEPRLGFIPRGALGTLVPLRSSLTHFSLPKPNLVRSSHLETFMVAGKPDDSRLQVACRSTLTHSRLSPFAVSIDASFETHRNLRLATMHWPPDRRAELEHRPDVPVRGLSHPLLPRKRLEFIGSFQL